MWGEHQFVVPFHTKIDNFSFSWKSKVISFCSEFYFLDRTVQRCFCSTSNCSEFRSFCKKKNITSLSIRKFVLIAISLIERDKHSTNSQDGKNKNICELCVCECSSSTNVLTFPLILLTFSDLDEKKKQSFCSFSFMKTKIIKQERKKKKQSRRIHTLGTQ